MRRATLFSLVVLLAGCTMGPDYQRPKIATPANFRAPSPLPADEAASVGDLKWFEVFRDEKLQGLVKTALVSNYDLRDAVARIEEARASLGITRRVTSGSSADVPGAGGVVPPSKGLRGMLDNIVTDGMRVASEVRRRMEEAGRELDRASGAAGGAAGRDEDDDDDDHDDGAATDSERRSVRSVRCGRSGRMACRAAPAWRTPPRPRGRRCRRTPRRGPPGNPASAATRYRPCPPSGRAGRDDWTP